MPTWTTVSTSSTSWTSVPETAQGYIETEDNLSVLATEDGDLIKLETATVINTDDWQELTPVSTTTWTIQ